ncbi:MAG: hypothetical protein ACM3WV_09170 [Bacillota bacterium]
MSILSRNGFGKDLAIYCMIIVALISFTAAGIAEVSHRYFGKAVVGLIGAYGEYDVMLQVRADRKEEAYQELKSLVFQVWPGSRLKPGLTIAGKTTFFLGFSRDLRRPDTFLNLAKNLERIPGWNGYSLLIEPKLTVTAVPGGAVPLLQRDIERIPGVEFSFPDGADLVVVLQQQDFAPRIKKQIQKVMNKYQVLEVRFPVQYPIEDKVVLGRMLADKLAGATKAALVQDVSQSSQGDDLAAISSTLSEIKKFLMYYSAEIDVVVNGEEILHRGDQILLKGAASRPVAEGDPVRPGNILISIESFAPGEGLATGRIVQGDSAEITMPEAYRLTPDGKAGRYVGEVSVKSKRNEIVHAVDESSKLLSRLQAINVEGRKTLAHLLDTMDKYENMVEEVYAVQNQTEQLMKGIDLWQDTAGNQELQSLAGRLKKVSGEIENLANAYGKVEFARSRMESLKNSIDALRERLGGDILAKSDPDTPMLGSFLLVNNILQQMENQLFKGAQKIDTALSSINPVTRFILTWQGRIKSFADFVTGLVFPQDKWKALDLLEDVYDTTGNALTELRGLNIAGLRGDLGRIGQQMASLDTIDVDAIVNQLELIRDSLPRLRDEEIGRSIVLIDMYAGDDLSGQSVRLLADKGFSAETAQRVISRAVKYDRVKVQALPVGVFEPEIRTEVFRVLREVRGTLAAIFVYILLFLCFLLDLMPVLAYIKWRRKRGKPGRMIFTDILFRGTPPVYAATGAASGILLSACYLLAGAAVPMVSLWQVAFTGILMGCYFIYKAEAYAPLNYDEIMACEAFGLPSSVVLREIIIPENRPGIFKFLNSRMKKI